MSRRISLVRAVSLCAALVAPHAEAALTQRWSFNSASGSVVSGTTLVDSISGTSAVVRGIGASFDASALVLPGTTTGNVTPATISAYLDLPN